MSEGGLSPPLCEKFPLPTHFPTGNDSVEIPRAEELGELHGCWLSQARFPLARDKTVQWLHWLPTTELGTSDP
ncbi:hypothetical protein GH733_015809 [Mirounga leonina]|nr:hypothetical protein GH733_015809 [Mirounga leonina]